MGGMRNSCCCTNWGAFTINHNSNSKSNLNSNSNSNAKRTLTASWRGEPSQQPWAKTFRWLLLLLFLSVFVFVLAVAVTPLLCAVGRKQRYAGWCLFVSVCLECFPTRGGRAVQFGRLSSECQYLRNLILPRDCSQCILLRYFSLFFLICALLLSSCLLLLLLLLLLALLICFCFRCLVQRFIVRHTLRSAADYNNNLHSTHQ